MIFDIPSVTSLSEHVYRLIDEWNLPVSIYPREKKSVSCSTNHFYASLELEESLRLFFKEQTQLAADQATQLAIEPVIHGQIEIKKLLDHWLKLVDVN